MFNTKFEDDLMHHYRRRREITHDTELEVHTIYNINYLKNAHTLVSF